jgi:uncharacterized protein
MLNKLKLDLLKARKKKDTNKVSVLGFLLSAIQNKEIDLRGQGEELTNEHVEKVLRKQIKNRNQSIEAYTKGNRQDLVDKESSELVMLEGLLDEYFG